MNSKRQDRSYEGSCGGTERAKLRSCKHSKSERAERGLNAHKIATASPGASHSHCQLPGTESCSSYFSAMEADGTETPFSVPHGLTKPHLDRRSKFS